MRPIRCLETLATRCQVTWHYISEQHSPTLYATKTCKLDQMMTTMKCNLLFTAKMINISKES
jgi:hypothetical protein